MRRHGRALTWAVAWILGIATAAVAQNVVSNAEFDNPVETDGWVPIYASEWTYAPNDANGCDLSGGGYGASTAIADPARPQYFYVYSPGCLAVSPGQAMYLDFQYLAPGVEAVRYLLLTYSSADCTTGQSGFYSPGQIGGVGQWTRASWSILNVFNAASVRLVFDAWNSTATSFSLVFDRVYLGATPRIYSDDFEGGTSACRWSASIL